jgi:GT2 family glycosyltransferase
MERAKGDTLLFLNPDTEILAGAIDKLYTSLNSLVDVGLVSPRLLNSDLSLQTNCVQTFPTIINQVLDLEFLRVHFPKCRWWNIAALYSQKEESLPVEAVPGASMMLKKKIFLKVGKFSTDYFMYAEDLDLCYKIKNLGLHIYHVSGAKIIHHDGSSTKEKNLSHFSTILMRDSVFRFLQKIRGRSYAFWYRFATMIISIIRLLILLPISFIAKNKNHFQLSVIKWKRILSWTLGLEKWVKEYNVRNMW